MTKHPAYTTPFDVLVRRLEEERTAGNVSCKVHPQYPNLTLWTYTQQCVFTKAWNRTTSIARGLILDIPNGRIVAAPFPKFFNLGERDEPLPNLPFEVFEKMDGSLIILYHYDGKWRTATKGSFVSEQAQWAQAQFDKQNLKEFYTGPTTSTFLFEAIYPENKIVVEYDYEALVYLGGYDREGEERSWIVGSSIAKAYGWKLPRRTGGQLSVADIVASSKGWNKNEEGVVIRYSDGTRIKIKGDEYLRLHRAMSRLTPLHVWEMMRDKVDLTAFKRDLPEEFWNDFDQIAVLLSTKWYQIVEVIRAESQKWNYASNKQIGLALNTMSPIVSKLIFPYRAGKMLEGRSRITFFNSFRPHNNKLEGYVPNKKLEQLDA